MTTVFFHPRLFLIFFVAVNYTSGFGVGDRENNSIEEPGPQVKNDLASVNTNFDEKMIETNEVVENDTKVGVSDDSPPIYNPDERIGRLLKILNENEKYFEEARRREELLRHLKAQAGLDGDQEFPRKSSSNYNYNYQNYNYQYSNGKINRYHASGGIFAFALIYLFIRLCAFVYRANNDMVANSRQMLLTQGSGPSAEPFPTIIVRSRLRRRDYAPNDYSDLNQDYENYQPSVNPPTYEECGRPPSAAALAAAKLVYPGMSRSSHDDLMALCEDHDLRHETPPSYEECMKSVPENSSEVPKSV